MEFKVIREAKKYPTGKSCPECNSELKLVFHPGRPTRPYNVCSICNKWFNSKKGGK